MGFARVTDGGPSLDQQLKALAAAGVRVDPDPLLSDVFIEDGRTKTAKRARRDAVSIVPNGGRLVVYSVERLAISEGDLADVLRAVANQGGEVWDCDAGEVVRWSDDVDAYDRACRRLRTLQGRVRTRGVREAQARAKAEGRPIKSGRKRILDDAEARAIAWSHWTDDLKSAGEAADATATDIGRPIGWRTLYLEFGPKGKAEGKAGALPPPLQKGKRS